MQTVLHACTLHTVSYGVQNTYKWYHPTHMVGIRKIGLSHYTKQEFSSSKQRTWDSDQAEGEKRQRKLKSDFPTNIISIKKIQTTSDVSEWVDT